MGIETSLLVAEQCYLSLPLPEVCGNQDYKDVKNLLEKIDSLLLKANIEMQLKENFLTEAQKLSQKEHGKELSEKERLKLRNTFLEPLSSRIMGILINIYQYTSLNSVL